MTRPASLVRAARRVVRRTPRPPAFASPNPALHNWLVDHIYAGEYDRRGFVAGRGDVVVDVGANIGVWSVLSAQRGARVRAYEPHPRTFEYLRRNAGTRGVLCHQAAIVGRRPPSGTVTLFLDPGHDTRHSLLGREQRTEERLGDSIDVPVATLADAIGDGCSLLKLDCEGAEFELIDATPTETLRRAERIVAELHGTGDRIEAFGRRLRSDGYEVAMQEAGHERLRLCFARRRPRTRRVAARLDRLAERFPGAAAAVLEAAGNRASCPNCASSFGRFAAGPDGTPDRRCWRCGSLERHRQIALLLRSRPQLMNAGMRVLHIAPEEAIRRLLPAACDYVAGDLEPGPGQRRVDITDMREFDDRSFDAVLCNHVMEHVPDDRAALREIRRILRPGGWATLMTPIVCDVTDEDPTITDPAERLRRFGQRDHIRRYGEDYVERLEEAGLSVEVVRQGAELSPGDRRRHRLANLQGAIEPTFLATRPPEAAQGS